MRNLILIAISFTLSICSPKQVTNTSDYFYLINKAELLICINKFKEATEVYNSAFNKIQKPFGKDVFNAALACQFSKKYLERDKYLQIIINNCDDLEFVESIFIQTYISIEEWRKLISKRKIDYNPKLRQEFIIISERDQLLRPLYETHDDTIKTNENINLARILHLTDSMGFPSHIELGYTNRLRGQNHNIVLHHLAQRRSIDKSVIDLEALLLKAVNEERFDPETAILYMNFQNDPEKGNFEVYSTWQYKHPLLPDNLKNKVWLPKLDSGQKEKANNKRREWKANSLDEIAIKTNFLSNSNLPSIFTSVMKSIGNFPDDFDAKAALDQYKVFTKYMEECKEKNSN